MKLLVIDDEVKLAEYLRKGLTEEGFVVDLAHNGVDGLHLAMESDYELIVLDGMLPGIDGLGLLGALRQSKQTPVLMLTARVRVEDRVRGLQSGADDYLVKPFGAAELLARVRAQLRRQALAPSSAQSVLRFGRTTVDLARRVVERDGERLHLTPIEYRLLTHLAAQPDRVVTHQQLLKAVWGPGHAEDTHYVRVHMANLRKKVEDDASRPRHLLTEAGIGYRFRP